MPQKSQHRGTHILSSTGEKDHRNKLCQEKKSRSESVNRADHGHKDEMEADFFTISIREKKVTRTD